MLFLSLCFASSLVTLLLFLGYLCVASTTVLGRHLLQVDFSNCSFWPCLHTLGGHDPVLTLSTLEVCGCFLAKALTLSTVVMHGNEIYLENEWSCDSIDWLRHLLGRVDFMKMERVRSSNEWDFGGLENCAFLVHLFFFFFWESSLVSAISY